MPPPPDTGWRLEKGARRAACRVEPHPLGLELVIEVDGEIVRTEVARTAAAAAGRTDELRAAFLERGWRATADV
jgi:hypothetical protein